MLPPSKQNSLYLGPFRGPAHFTKARRAYLEAILRRDPEVLVSLKEQVLPLYMKRETSYARWWLFKDYFIKQVLFIITSLDWARQYHLVTRETKPDDPALFVPSHESTGESRPGECSLSGDGDLFSRWILPVVESTLAGWVRDPAKLEDLRWTMPGDEPSLSPVEVPGCTYVFHCKAWDPESDEPRAAALQRILDDVRDQAMKTMEAQIQDHLSRGRKKASCWVDLQMFDRLVLYQVGGWCCKGISKKDEGGCGEKGVRKSIEKAARLVIGDGWHTWLRRNPVGRPKGGNTAGRCSSTCPCRDPQVGKKPT
jgi:hypothetical protein